MDLSIENKDIDENNVSEVTEIVVGISLDPPESPKEFTPNGILKKEIIDSSISNSGSPPESPSKQKKSVRFDAEVKETEDESSADQKGQTHIKYKNEEFQSTRNIRKKNSENDDMPGSTASSSCGCSIS